MSPKNEKAAQKRSVAPSSQEPERESIPVPDADEPGQKRTVFPLPPGALSSEAAEAARFAYIDRFIPLRIPVGDGVLQSAAMRAWRDWVADQSPEQSIARTRRVAEDEEMLLTSDFGIVFKERTRVVPAGFALGEHIVSLSLAPMEEVTIEQKAYSERLVTYEEATETTRELDVELSSTYSTELSTQLQTQLSETSQSNFDIGGQIGGNIKGVDVSVSPKWSSSLTQADQTTRNESLRQTASQTQKLASKFRAQHKITMRVSETTRFEATTRRVLRNPSSSTPIDLVYFKIMQRLRLSQERFGVRLCWAPFIPDPGAITESARQQARAHFEALHPLRVPPEPVRPVEPGRPTQVVQLGWQELTNWGFWGDMKDDYEFTIAAPANHEWDGDEGVIRASLTFRTTGWGGRPTPSVWLVSAGSNGSGGVVVRIHGGAGVGGPGAHLYVDASATFRATAGAPPDPEYAQLLAAWETEHAAWVQAAAEARAERDARVEAAFAEWSAKFWREFDPASAAMQLLVKTLFPPDIRDDSWEVDAWTTYFEFERGAIKLYPGWWNNRPLRDPQAGPASFQNASWGRVFLQIRPGYERAALTWLVERRLFTPEGGDTSDAIEQFVDDLEQHRAAFFGGADEIAVAQTIAGQPCPDLQTPFVCLGTWDETLPTDGTHLEVLQANTSAADALTERLALQRAEALEKQNALIEGVAGKMSPAKVDVVVNVAAAGDSRDQA